VYATRRERRAAERAGAAAAPSTLAATDHVAVSTAHRDAVPFELPAFVTPRESARSVPEPARHVAHARRPSPRRRTSFARFAISAAAMLSAAGLAVGVSVPASATFGAPPPLEAESMSLAPVVEAAPAPQQGPGFELHAASSAADLRAAVASARAETSFTGESKAQILRARYLSAGRPYEPGFIPTTGSVRWPFPKSVEISSGFGERDIGFHGGTDFVPGYGTPVGAIADGIVTWVGRDRTNFGYYVTIAHVIDGVRVDSLYAHLIDDSSEAYELYPGMEIAVGAPIGDTGNTGFSTGPHLHLEIHLEGVPVNPFEWLTINAR